MKAIKLIVIALAIMVLPTTVSSIAYAQNKTATITVTGTVTDKNGEPCIGCGVIVKNQPGLGTTTDADGKYSIKTGAHETLVFSCMAYADKEVPIEGRKVINVVLEDDATILEEVVVVGAGYQKKATLVGAVTPIPVDRLQVHSGNLSTALAGNVAGVIAVQRSGEPGQDASEFWIRGISTFGANSSALVLVDGIERNFDQINIEDIESFSVLKDASATAIYGQRGANGVVIITTKHGDEGKVNINFKSEYSVSGNAMAREFVNAAEYAALANEARMSRYNDPVFDTSELEIIEYGLDQDLYPNVDWQNVMERDHTSSYKGALNISGGGSTARYYISGSYFNQESIYKDNLKSEYGRGSGYSRYNYRLNTDLNITKTTILDVGVGGWVATRRMPGYTSNGNFWSSIGYMTPISAPLVYSNGQIPTYGTDNNLISPYVLLNYTGYSDLTENKVETNISLRQDLSFITEGLNAVARFSYDSYNVEQINRLKMPEVFMAERMRNFKGELITKRVGYERPLYQSSSASGWTRAYGEAQINYDRIFDKHHVTGLIYGYLQSYREQMSRGESSDTHSLYSTIPRRNMALSGRFVYGYDDRYLLELNFGYTGSENFEKGQRFGFFPAIAAGWVLSNEPWIKRNADWMNLFKIRYSYGKVGNDQITSTRFPYITTVANGSGVYFGNQGANFHQGLKIGILGASGLTWEVATKHDLGLDLKLFNRFEMTVDAFLDRRTDIFMRRAYLPASVGLEGGDQNPMGNVGSMESKGFDGNFGYTQPIGRDLSITLRGNFTYAYTNVLEYDEASNALYYQMTKGYRWGQNRGLIALGLFESEDEIASSPSQYNLDLMPGDIKYKVVIGDGTVNDDDIVPIGNTLAPGLIYGFGLSAQYKGFDLSFLFQGAGLTDFVLGGYSAFPFSGGDTGNVLKVVADQKNRWTSASISGDPATENQDVIFPRLTYNANTNNQKWSTWWLRDASYLRLKNVELGYTLPRSLTQKIKMDRCRLYVQGFNLFCWSAFDWWDPEQGSTTGDVYPIQRSVTFGLNLSF